MEQEMYKVPHHIITKLQAVIKKYRGNKESIPGLDQITGIVGNDGWISKTQCKKIKTWWNNGNSKDKEKKDIYTYSLINWCVDQVNRANAKNQRSNDIRTSTGMTAKTKSQDGREVDRLNTNATKPSEPARVQYYEGVNGKDLLDDELLKYAKLVHYDLEEGSTDIFHSFLIDLFPPGGGEKVQVQIQSKNHSTALKSARKLYKGFKVGRVKRL